MRSARKINELATRGFKCFGFGLSDAFDYDRMPKTITNKDKREVYLDRKCKCGETFFSSVGEQVHCSDRCKWLPAIRPHLIPKHIHEEKKVPQQHGLLGCVGCTNYNCLHINATLKSTDKRGRMYSRDYVVQSAEPYACNTVKT